MLGTTRMVRTTGIAAVACALVVGTVTAAGAAAAPAGPGTAPGSSQGTATPKLVRTLAVGDGTTITLDSAGTARHLGTRGQLLSQQRIPLSPGKAAVGGTTLPTDDTLRTLLGAGASGSAPDSSNAVIAVLPKATLTGAVRHDAKLPGARTPVTSDARINTALRSVHATTIRPLLAGLPTEQATKLQSAASAQLGGTALDLTRTFVVDVAGQDADAAAAALRATAGVSFAEPDRVVSAMNTGGTPLPAASRAAEPKATPAAPSTSPGALPTNYGLTSSLQSFLNAGGVNAMGAYSELTKQYGQLPGTGETITNVSIGDLTDQSMADNGDGYVQTYGPTTVLEDGQRYLDLPSMPLIPTYTAAPDGSLDPTGSTEGEDPTLDEVLLDFGVMAPLPHDRQRPDALGSGDTDLLGIAPGAKYRLVVPQQPTTDQIAVALLAAARQSPRPDVITASLGFGTDAQGFPGRYLEDDPLQQAVIAAIVRQYHIVVCISSNDGTRLYTPASIGPDGGSTPTDVTKQAKATTSIADDGYSTTPSVVQDSGAIAVGGTTLDDTLAVPQQAGGTLSRTATFATTRTDGGSAFSSGFGTRVNVSAPSDGIAVFEHPVGGSAQSTVSVLNGGTSASAPMTAAAAAVVLQAARLGSGRTLTPAQVRTTLERTARAVASPPQADRRVSVGPQVDVTAAVDSVLAGSGHPKPAAAPAGAHIVRLSVAHRITIGGLGASFTEATDPDRIDLSGDSAGASGASGGTTGSGEGLVGPVTFGVDVAGMHPGQRLSYRLIVGDTDFDATTPSVRITPTELLTAAGLPVISTGDRTVDVTMQVRQGNKVLDSVQRSLVVGATDGSYVEAQAPVVPGVVKAGQPVTVHYDLTGVRTLKNPQLAVSTVGHPNPVTAPIFSAAWTAPLTATTGTVTVPASAFDGGGVYGIGIVQQSADPGMFGNTTYGEFSTVRVDGGTPAQRPGAPLVAPAGGSYGHGARVTAAAPGFTVKYDVSQVAGAAGTIIEISAPAPTLYNSLNTVTNANGTRRDQDGVDAGSVLYRALDSTHGTLSLDAAALRLTDADSYNVRVLAADVHGAAIGQASPTSLLTFDDGAVPGGGGVDSFAVSPGADSVAVVRDADGALSVRPYTPATGSYGAAITSDPDASDAYDVIGTDPTDHRLLLRHDVATGYRLETYDLDTGELVAAADVASGDYALTGGLVDATRHRAAILGHRLSDRADVVLPVDLSTGRLGEPIDVDTGNTAPSSFGLLAMDAGTGTFYATNANSSLICFRAGTVAAVDLGTRSVTTGSGQGCVNAVATDASTHTLYELSYRSFSVNIAGTSNLIAIDDAGLSTGSVVAVRQQPSKALAVDPVHHLAFVSFTTPPTTPHFGNAVGLFADNNATGQLAEIDLTTGKLVANLGGFNFTSAAFVQAPGGGTEQRVQLDPATRTGWTFSPDGTQLQRFSY